MRSNILISIFLSVLAAGAQADDSCVASKLENVGVVKVIQAGEVTCIGRSCYYVPQKTGTSPLIQALRKAITGSISDVFNSDKGFVAAGRERGEISFWHDCQQKLDEMKDLVVRLDSPVLQTGRRRIQLRVKIYHMTSSDFNNLSFGISGILDGAVDTAPARGSVTNSAGGFDLSFAFGNLTNHMLNIDLMNSKGRNKAYELRDVPFEIMEGEDINRSLTRNNYRDPKGLGDQAIESTGYNLNGRAYVDETGEEPLVILKDFSIRYSIPVTGNPNALADVLNVSRWEIALPNGRPFLLSAENFSQLSENKGRSFPFYLEDSTIRSESKLVVFISGWPADSPPQEDTQLKDLSSEEISDLKPQPLKDPLQAADFSVVSTGGTADFDLITFQLDQEGLSSENYNRLIRVEVLKGRTTVHSSLAEHQHLVTGTYQLPSLFGSSTREAKLKVRLSWASESAKIPRGQKKKVTYSLLHYQGLKRVEVTGQR